MNPPCDEPVAATHWHGLPACEALARLGVIPAQRLARDEALRRLAENGPNTLPEAGHRPLWRVLLRQFASPLIYILLPPRSRAPALEFRRNETAVRAG